MAAGLLHEIGNPLNFMGTALQLASRDPTVRSDPDTADTIKDIQEGYERIHRVVTNLRGFTAPQRPEHPRPFTIDFGDRSRASIYGTHSEGNKH